MTSRCLSANTYLEFDLGLNLFGAACIGHRLFIGRTSELQDMENILLPNSNSLEQRVLILGGMGGIGKTQLAITYAHRHRTSYTSIFWLNANSETTLTGSLRLVARRILPPNAESRCDNDQVWIHVSTWLSQLENSRWLLIFDNYDEPDQYSITKYYPYVSHGSIIITTRLPERLNGEKIRVQPVAKLEDSLHILETRSGRKDIQSGDSCLIFILRKSY